VIAYLMRKLKIGFNEAYHYLKRIKEDINPNEGFMEKLKEYEKDVFNSKF
jgi:hypothetical protein